MDLTQTHSENLTGRVRQPEHRGVLVIAYPDVRRREVLSERWASQYRLVRV